MTSKRKVSWVWTHFARDENEPNRRKCLVEGCRFMSTQKNSNSTTPMSNHLMMVHDINAPQESEDSGKQTGSMKRFLRGPRSGDEWLSRQVCLDGISMNVLAKSEFQAVAFPALGFRHYKSPTSVSKVVNTYLLSKREELKVEMASMVKDGLRFGATMDEWSSAQGGRYLNVCLTSGAKVFNLGLVRCRGSLTAANIQQMFVDRLTDFGIKVSDLVGFTTDGCASMMLCGKNLKLQTDMEHQQCMSHAIHLAVLDVLYLKRFTLDDNEEILTESDDHQMTDDDDLDNDELEESFILNIAREDEVLPDLSGQFSVLIAKVRRIVKYFKFDKRNEILQAKIAEIQKNKNVKVSQVKLQFDCVTRWNSLIGMVNSILKEPVPAALRECAFLFNDLDALTEEEVLQLGGLRDALQPLEILTKNVCSKDFNVYEAEVLFMETFEILKSLNTNLADSLENHLRGRYQERRSKGLISVIQFLSDPTGTMISDFELLSHSEIVAKANKMFKRLFPEQAVVTPDVPESSHQAAVLDEPFEVTVAKRMAKRMKELKEKKKVHDGQDIITDNIIAASKTGELSNRLVLLQSALTRLPATSTDSERAFSVAGRFVTKIRGRLSPACLDNFCFGHAFFKNQGFYYFPKQIIFHVFIIKII